MHLVQLNLFFDDDLGQADELLDRYRAMTGWAEAVAGFFRDHAPGGGRVRIVQRFRDDVVIERNDVRYHFVADRHGGDPGWWQRSGPAVRTVVECCREALAAGHRVVVHLNGLGYGAALPGLRRRLPRSVPIVVQHHAERPSAGCAGLVQRRGLRHADGLLFSARALANDWIERGVVAADAAVFQVAEGSTDFEISDRRRARRQTGVSGSPLLLWVGRLDANKDPLGVLAGVEPVLAARPEARMAAAFGPESPLRDAVERRIASSDVLSRAVRLLGTVPHDRMAAVYNSADCFVLGSHYEGSGFAVVEAMACGVVPVVTDIPSFRAMTRDGAIGGLWTPGEPASLTAVLDAVLEAPLEAQSSAARRQFEDELSWPAIARDAVAAYRTVCAAREKDP